MGGRLSKVKYTLKHNYHVSNTDGGVYITPSEFRQVYQWQQTPDIPITNSRVTDHVTDGNHVTRMTPISNDTEDITFTEIAELGQASSVAHMVEVFQPLIEGSIIVSEVLPHLPFIDLVEVRNKETYTVAMLLERIRHSEEPGKWQSFCHALDHAEYPYIKRLIKGETEIDHSISKELLKIFTPQLIQRMEPGELIDHFFQNELINHSDMEEIRREENRRGKMAASVLILDRVQRRHVDWYARFVDILKRCSTDMDDLVEELHPPPPCGQATIDHQSCPNPYIYSGHTQRRSEVTHAIVNPLYDTPSSEAPPCYSSCSCSDLATRPKQLWKSRSQSFGLNTPNAIYNKRPITRHASIIDRLESVKDRKSKELEDRHKIEKLFQDIDELDKKIQAITNRNGTDDEVDAKMAIFDTEEDTIREYSDTDFIPGFYCGTEPASNYLCDTHGNVTRVPKSQSTASNINTMTKKLETLVETMNDIKTQTNEVADFQKQANNIKVDILEMKGTMRSFDSHLSQVTGHLRRRLRVNSNPPSAHHGCYSASDSGMFSICSTDSETSTHL